MPEVVIIGGGHNGLVAAAYLAKAGLRPVVLERQATVGGVLVTEEIHPGFRCPTLLHTAGPLHPDVVSDLRLASHGLQSIESDVSLLSLLPDGRALRLYRSAQRSAAEIARISPADATEYETFCGAVESVAAVLSALLRTTPPDSNALGIQDLGVALRSTARVLALGQRDRTRLVQWLTMPVADAASDWFEHDALRAAVAARALFGSFLGPRSAGTMLGLLLQAAAGRHPLGSATFSAGGPGALTSALVAAATSAGAETRTRHRVSRILVERGSVAGVRLDSGQELSADLVVSAIDPKQTFLNLVEPRDLDPSFRSAIRHYRSRGVVAKVNLALSSLPRFRALDGAADATQAVASRIHVGDDLDTLERAFDAAKHGRIPDRPLLELSIPSVLDPALAPPGSHVMSIYAQFVPCRLRETSWETGREGLGDAVVRMVSEHAPGFERLVVHRQVIGPADLEASLGLTGGHLFHGEPSLDQLFLLRPLAALSRYRSPIGGLYLCGSGTHPGFGITGCSGANAAREILRDLRASR